ncbi:MAG: hypothetical protein NTY38_22280 [Acidobacteria bacterium]|nr:hypothetical protein [Acidobacteriota bacterium]
MHRVWLSLVALAGISAAAGPPTVNDVLDRYVAAIGGQAAHQRIRTIHSVASIEFRGMGRKATRTMYRAAPNKSYSVVEIEGFGRLEEGADGNVAWTINPKEGPRLKTGDERDIALRAASWNGEMRLRELYPKIELAGAETVNGRPSYKLLFTPPSGPVMTRFFDQETSLLVRAVMKVNTPAGDRDVETEVSDYRSTDGVRTPFHITQTGAGPLMIITIETLEYNTAIPASRFDLPAEIRQLLK